MTSIATRELHLNQRRTWLRGAEHAWAFSDGYGMTHTPASPYDGGTWRDAQHRQLRGLQWLRLPANVDWVMLVDDDTWVDRPALECLMARFSKTRTLIGYRAENGVFNGGAGLLLSRRLADEIARRLYTRTCPFAGTNDATITACAAALGANLTHEPRFAFYPDTLDEAPDGFITLHPVKEYALMRALGI